MTDVRDYMGKEIRVGDVVVCMSVRYANFMKGTVTKITPKKVKIGDDIYRYYGQVVVVGEEE